METSLNKLVQLLSDKQIIEIENSIASKLNCDIYKDNLPLLAKFLKEEIEQSQLSISQIENFINGNMNEIIRFGLTLLEKHIPKTLSTGIAISYSIYMIYLKEKNEAELLEYLKRRRIPTPKKLLEQLLDIKKKNNI